MENYKYFVNKNCEYYPCHRGVDPEEWSCLFCYCPWFWHCGSKGKDGILCPDCIMPHDRNRWCMIQRGLASIKVEEDKKKETK